MEKLRRAFSDAHSLGEALDELLQTWLGAVLRVSLFRRGERLRIVTERGGLGKLEEIDNGRIYVDVVCHNIQKRRGGREV